MKTNIILACFFITSFLMMPNFAKAQNNASVFVAQNGDLGFRLEKNIVYVCFAQNGNIIGFGTKNGGDLNYDFNGRLNKIGISRIFYDFNGKIIKIDSENVFYDFNGRLNRVGDINISYDFNGKVNKIGAQRVYYDFNGRVQKISTE